MIEIDISEFLGPSYLNLMLEAKSSLNENQAWLTIHSKENPTYYPHIKVMDGLSSSLLLYDEFLLIQTMQN